ncbi:beta-ketoacyl-[acyl-carrier-protein] synthase family protein [Marinagarivorans cellulosilyticus]|uniref:3-oxoacyl-[acyl-carrier-protein] synthase I n=1 Tax=Marinagarivorans cellulosilyticus TaxID=2721545 RepID=A0AAN1WFX7_9GAMM|nr:beta-ketoacyl-[acyl-carrier-protein] synthase family protein [Marinagarivorans cellulosilyticus]BCD96815.1 3-oxoacyl-[acyl-carrier-protein] synthase I [Marinagarivorans cellulosilyticus]
MQPLLITDYTYTSCLAAGREQNWQAIKTGDSKLKPCDFYGINDLSTWVGEVSDLDTPLPQPLSHFDCRNNRLAWLALQQDNFLAQAKMAVQRYGASRVAVFVGTSTSGIHETEKAYFESHHKNAPLPEWYNYQTTHNIYSSASFTAFATGATGPASAISTACSSSAKVFATAQRAIASGLCDAAIVGGVDSLCLTTLYGFHALQLISANPCKPFDTHRDGINIGEGAGFAILEKIDAPHLAGSQHPQLLGYGESSDAYHMSSPHPDGRGAFQAMTMALHKAGLDSANIDYINLHGTGTPANDRAESAAVAKLFKNSCPASSTKGWTGHTLGAAGIIEIAICLQALQHNIAPKNKNLEEQDPNSQIHILKNNYSGLLQYALSNSFGFGGSNCSLVVGVK